MRVVSQIVLFLFSLNVLVSYSQDKDFNIIISVDTYLEKVYATELILNSKDGKIETIQVKYIPGRLTVSEKDYQKLTSENVMSMNLKVRYDKMCKGKTKYFNYEIEDFKLHWLANDSYFILYIYNTNNKKYRKIYDPLPGKEFTFDYDWGGGASVSRMQKKLTREQKKCRVKL